jgi:hypothetical protein
MAFHPYKPPLMTRRQCLLSILLVGSIAMHRRVAAWLHSSNSVTRNGWVLSVDD